MSRVLVFHTGSLGDTIISIPALRAIRKHWRGQEITLLHNATPPHLAGPEELLSELGLVDKFLTYPATGGSLRRMTGAIRCLCTLRRKQFDTVIYLLRDRPADSVRRDGIYFALAGIKVRLGFAAGGNAIPPASKCNETRPATHQSRSLVRRLRELGADLDLEGCFEMPLLAPSREFRSSAAEFLRKYRVAPERDLAAICPGAKTSANRWPIIRFVELARRVTSELGWEVILLGGPADAQSGQMICRSVPGTIDACGKLSILEVAAVMELCRVVVGLDTGTTHLAAAVGTPVVGIYGARNPPGQWDPLGQGHRVLRLEVPCEGCGLETCPVPGHPCISGLSVDQVFNAVRRGATAHGAGDLRRSSSV